MTAGTGAYDRRFDSGRICLDLVATGAGPSGACEQLAGPGPLGEWLVAAALVPRGTALAAVDDDWVTRFRHLRADLGRLLTAELGGARDDTALDRVNALAAGPPPGLRAVRAEGGALTRTLNAP
ncbi:ABATE domain-containing protein, partial [Streptomyces sp. 24-1644]|uniref:ABATE domain-containing protein n=1 Tax=Streptomyces sp. 24-1644 TaxID=3457315 RepID=UPI003FA749F3